VNFIYQRERRERAHPRREAEYRWHSGPAVRGSYSSDPRNLTREELLRRAPQRAGSVVRDGRFSGDAELQLAGAHRFRPIDWAIHAPEPRLPYELAPVVGTTAARQRLERRYELATYTRRRAR